MDNIVLVDFENPNDWKFLKGLESSSDIKWVIKRKKSNKDRKGKFNNLKRYFKYFFFSFNVFTHRKKYNKIVAWQQFYGLLFAFFCRLFHVKKRNDLTIMTFIYKPKKGFIGKIYFKFMRYIVTSKYIDRFIVFSSSEVTQYNNDFNINDNRFKYIPLGEDIIKKVKTNEINESNFVFSSGFSNRDFNFLIDVAHRLPNIKFMIYADYCYKKDNVVVTDELVGDKLDELLEKCRIVAVPLKENRQSGQLTVIHAMEAGVPVIVTNADAMKDYIRDNDNGFICENSVELWAENINKLYTDDELYKRFSIKEQIDYAEKHTVESMGKNIGFFLKEKE